MFHRSSGSGIELSLDEFLDAREVVQGMSDEYAAAEGADYVSAPRGRPTAGPWGGAEAPWGRMRGQGNPPFRPRHRAHREAHTPSPPVDREGGRRGRAVGSTRHADEPGQRSEGACAVKRVWRGIRGAPPSPSPLTLVVSFAHPLPPHFTVHATPVNCNSPSCLRHRKSE